MNFKSLQKKLDLTPLMSCDGSRRPIHQLLHMTFHNDARCLLSLHSASILIATYVIPSGFSGAGDTRRPRP